MDAELKNLKIDRNNGAPAEPSKWATRWIIGGVADLSAARRVAVLSLGEVDRRPEVEVQRVRPCRRPRAARRVVLNATGYIVAAHKIQVAAKVVGKVKWIGVEKGDRVREGEVIVRLEDDEYQAQLQQAKGQLANLQARLDEALNGSRPEEVAQAQANVDSAKADLENARVTLDRNKRLVARQRGAQAVAG